MSDRPTRVTRRTLLKVSGLAPITALVACGASNDDIAAAAAAFTDVEDPPSHVRDKAEEHNGDLDEKLFAEVVWLLWLNFVAGTKPSGSPIEDGVAIIKRAYIMPTNDSPPTESGDKIVNNLGKWKDQDIDAAAATNWCAYQVGMEAGVRAKGMPITVDHFDAAWRDVAIKTKALFDRWESVGKKNGDDEFLRIKGLGC